MTDGTLAGYRLLRKLGSGSRADVYLASASGHPAPASGSSTSALMSTVAVKVFTPEVSREDVGTELDALGRVESPHVVRLLDIASSHTALPTLVFERIPRGSVAGLLRERAELEAGEAVTLLAPLAHLLPELHHAGIAHNRIGVASIHLGAGGEPVLLGFGHCGLFAENGTIAGNDARREVVGDREALAALALSILGQVRTRSTDGRLRELADWIQTAPRVYEFLPELESRLFDLAESVPIEFGRADGGVSTVPTRIGMPLTSIPGSAGVLEPAGSASQRSSRELPTWLPAALLESPVAALRERGISLIRGVRKPLWILAGGIVLALVLAVTLIPAGQPAAPPRVATERETTIPVPRPSTLPDDPLSALPILIRARTNCIHELSILCLDTVDEASSAAFLQDSTLVQQIQQGGEIPKSATIGYSGLTLVERDGDTALVSLGTGDPTSILLITGSTGWRIRDYLSGVQATSATPGPTR